MAKVKFSALISEMRNKLNGSVFSKNRSGNYLRNKVTPVNPNTSYQATVRNRLASFSASWRGLLQEEIESWNNAVANFLKTDIFGDVKTPTGKNLFVGLNLNLSAIGASLISNPPVPGAIPSIVGFGSTSEEGAEEVILTWSSGAVPAGFAWKVDATPPVSAGVNFVKSEYRQIGVLATAVTTGVDVGSQYVAKFGVPIAGQKIFVRLTAISTTKGQAGIPVTSSSIVQP